MVRGLVGAGQAQDLRAKLSQVPLHLLLLGALDVVFGGVLQVSLDLPSEEKECEETCLFRHRNVQIEPF